MFRNHLLVAFRNLLKNSLYTLINVAGLTLGITCALCIFLFVKDELSYDRYHSKADRIFRVIQVGAGEHSASLPFPAGPTVLHEHPDLVENSVRLFNFQASTLAVVYENGNDRKTFNEPRFFFADSTFFNVFDYKFLEGDAATALNGPGLVVITKSTAEKYFGTDEAVGKVIRFEGKENMTVSGVIEDVPRTSHFKFDFLASFITLRTMLGADIQQGNWYWNPVWTYVLLKDKVNEPALNKQLPYLVQKYYHPSLKKQTELVLQPLTDIFLKSKSEYEISAMSDIRYVYIFSGIGLAILLIACINFINLTTARSSERFKEIGVRKVMGAYRINLILQFITESMVITLASAILAGVLVAFAVPGINVLTEKQLSVWELLNPGFLAGFFAIAAVVGLISGGYPAFVLSSQEASKVLKSNTGKYSGSAILRKSLVVFQFVVSMIFISGTLVAYRQINFMQKADLGFVGEQILVLPVQRLSIIPKFESFKDVLLQNSNITNVSASNAIVGRDYQTNNYKRQGADDLLTYPVLFVRNDFIETMGLKLLAGHDFKKEFKAPGFQAIINRSMMEALGWKNPDDVIGQVLDGAMEGKVTITGVAENFNYASLKQKVGPLILVIAENNNTAGFFTNFILVRVKPQQIPKTIAFLKKEWKQFVEESPLEYFFLNDNLNRIYKTEEKFNTVTAIFSLIAIGIGAMGLFGLAAFSVQQRKKEISIRKILGASSNSVLTMLSGDFMRLIIIAGLVGVPASWFLMNKWLDGFAYRVDVGIVGLLASVCVIMIIAMLTISVQVLKAATGNPVDALRSE